MSPPSEGRAQLSRAERLRTLLAGFAGEPMQQSIRLAAELQERAVALQTSEERRQQDELERITLSAHDKATLVQITDQALRSGRAARVADQLIHILDVQGVPRFFTPLDQAMLQGFRSFGGYLPGIAVPLMQDKMREETTNVILPAEEEHLLAHLQGRRRAGLRMNLNLLGEALLGERAVEERLETYLDALQNPAIECLSVKISTLYSQISPLVREDTVAVLCDRLEVLYRQAIRARFELIDGSEVAKLLYLDMEEYRDMRLTAEAFMQTLERPGLAAARAGIALQAYLPDAHAVQREITGWARARVRAGGAPVTIRLVKGANMEMERFEAAVRGWPQAPFQTKRETDANYKRMLHFGLRPENITAVHLGIASHNLFDVAYALVLASQSGQLERIQIEMLEGMANHQRRALAEVTNNLLLYAPATRRAQFVHAIGYLVRRLDENTGPDNYLSHAFKLRVGSDTWRQLADQFIASCALIDGLPETPRRTQDRRQPPAVPSDDLRLDGFTNEPDTDFALAANLDWAKAIIARWQPRDGDQAAEVPLVVAGRERRRGKRTERACHDPSRPGTLVGRYWEARAQDLEEALDCAHRDPSAWRDLAPERRAAILGRVAQVFRERRGDLLGAAMADGGKTFTESDPEVSEAIDFIELYRRSALFFQRLQGLRATAKGVVAVIPPWNFPVAIPTGGVAAALAAGNCVILKPASDTVLVAWQIAQCFWAGGVPREALQFLPGSGGAIGNQLVTDPRVDAVVLTGGTDTAEQILKARPDLHLIAETGGKNATIVTALADRDQAIKQVLHSAFSHSGQKCSATSLLVLEAEVHDDPAFKAALCDAVESLPVGSAWQRRTRVGPLIRPPSGLLERGLKELEPGEHWAVRPRPHDDNPALWSPGVKWDVAPGGFTHLTELFGPVLAVMRARDLDHAIALVHQTGYGLTSGIESLDEREQLHWSEQVRAGNLYVNRVTTGAVVLRQPFGGQGKSAFGPGIKAGGPNYVAQLMDLEDRPHPNTRGAGPSRSADEPHEPLLAGLIDRLRRDRDRVPGVAAAEVDRVLAAAESYQRALADEFGREHDHFRLLGQDNLRRYRPMQRVCIRPQAEDSFFDLAARVAAARTLGCAVWLSLPPGIGLPGVDWFRQALEHWGEALDLTDEDDHQLALAVGSRRAERVRYAGNASVPIAIHRAANAAGVHLARGRVLAEGRIELLWYLREQSLSRDYHRYGNLGARGAEARAPVP